MSIDGNDDRMDHDSTLPADRCSTGDGGYGVWTDSAEKAIAGLERGDSLQGDSPNAFSDRSELDIRVTDIASFLSGKDEESGRARTTKWSTRRRRVKSPDFENDFNTSTEYGCGFVTPPDSVSGPGCGHWTPDVYESVTSSLKELRKTYRDSGSERTGDGESSSHTSPFVKADEYVVRLPNMDIEDKAMYIDKLIVKSFRHVNNLTKVRFRETLDDDVIAAVMERYRDRYADILFVTPCITRCVMVLQDRVDHFFDPMKANDYDFVFFVIGDAISEEGGTHWSLLVLDRPQKTFYHYDSMHGSHFDAAFELVCKVWSYFNIKKGYQAECEQQPDGADCGFYVVHNMLRCIKIIKEQPRDHDGQPMSLKEPLRLPLSVDQTKSVVIKTYVASIVEKIRKTATIGKY